MTKNTQPRMDDAKFLAAATAPLTVEDVYVRGVMALREAAAPSGSVKVRNLHLPKTLANTSLPLPERLQVVDQTPWELEGFSPEEREEFYRTQRGVAHRRAQAQTAARTPFATTAAHQVQAFADTLQEYQTSLLFGLAASLFAFGWLSAQGAANERVFDELKRVSDEDTRRNLHVVDVETEVPLSDMDAQRFAPHWRTPPPLPRPPSPWQAPLAVVGGRRRRWPTRSIRSRQRRSAGRLHDSEPAERRK
jgi:hypothetical protein